MEMVSSVPVAQQAVMTMMIMPLLKKLCVLLCMPQNAPECASECTRMCLRTSKITKFLHASGYLD